MSEREVPPERRARVAFANGFILGLLIGAFIGAMAGYTIGGIGP